MPPPRHAELRAAFEVLDRVVPNLYHQLADICTQGAKIDRRVMVEVIDFAAGRGILTHVGSQYVKRRQTTPQDLEDLLAMQPVDDPSTRLQAAHDEIESLLQNRASHLWLQLNFLRMPASTRESLRRQALEALVPGASDTAIETQMLLLAARVIQHAFRNPRDTNDTTRLPLC